MKLNFSTVLIFLSQTVEIKEGNVELQALKNISMFN